MAQPSFAKYDPTPDAAAVEIKAMRTRLEAVDRAIGQLQEKASTSTSSQLSSPPKSSSSLVQTLRPLIDTSSAQFGTCPHCFSVMPLSSMRGHMQSACPSREMTCPEHGCGATFATTDLKRHRDLECPVLHQRRQLVAQAQQRKQDKIEAARAAAAEAAAAKALLLAKTGYRDEHEHDISYSHQQARAESPDDESIVPAPTIVCQLCGDSSVISQQRRHAQVCRARLVYCPNRTFGCLFEVPFSSIQSHMRDCAVERSKAEMLKRSALRKEPVRCVGCGERFPLAELKIHEMELCANRKVACRNAHLGCAVVMRAQHIKSHEEADNVKARVRNCLFLSGLGASMALAEDDVPAPWTAEYWLYRPSARESAKQYIKAALMLVPPLNDAYSHQLIARAHVNEITAVLGDARGAAFSLEEREAALELLAEAVELLEDAALAAVAAVKTLGCAIGAAQQAMSEFLPTRFRVSEFPFPYISPVPPISLRPPNAAIGPNGSKAVEQERVSLKAQPPGEPSLDKNDAPEGKSRGGSRGGSRGASRGASGGATRIGSASGGEKESKAESGEDIEGARPQEVEPNEASVQGEEALHEDAVVRGLGAEGGVQPDPTVQPPELSPEPAAAATDEAPSSVQGEMEFEPEPEPEPEPESEPEAEPELPPPAWYPPEAGPLAATAQLLRLPKVPPFRQSAFPQSRQRAANTPMTPFNAAAGKPSTPLERLYEKGSVPPPAGFLLESLATGRRGGAGQGSLTPLAYNMQLSWPEWWLVSVLLADCLWLDRVALREELQASGLLGKIKLDAAVMAKAAKPIEASKQGPALTEDEIERQKAAKAAAEAAAAAEAEAAAKALKKEKARLRREAKMKKGQQQALQDQEEEEKEKAQSEGRARDDSQAGEDGAVAEQLKKEERARAERDARQRERENKKHIKDRLVEVERAYCGADMLGACSSYPGQTSDRLCLEMSPYPASWKERLDKENKFLVAGDKKKKKADGDGENKDALMDPRDNALPGKVGVVLASCSQGGPGCFSFPAGVARECWVHLCLVASPDPNRLTLYLDGIMKGSLKDCALPLPMAAIAAPSPLSLSAAFLDIRLWTKVRSQQEIGMTMHRLISLEDRVAAANEASGKRSSNSPSSKFGGKKPPPPSAADLAPALAPGQPDLSSRGLMLWFPFEDGAGSSRLSDVTESRYPTPLSRNLVPLPLLPPKIPESSAPPASAAGATSIVEFAVAATVIEVGEPAAPPTPDFASLPHEPLSGTIADALPSSPPRVLTSDRPRGVVIAKPAAPAHKHTPWLWLEADNLPLPNNPPLKPGEDLPLPVPSFSQKGVCVFELRRMRLAQRGRQLYKEVPCPQGCGDRVVNRDVRFHVSFECSRRLVPCRFGDLCHASYPLDERSQHERGGASSHCAHTRAQHVLSRSIDFANEAVPCAHCSLEVKRRHMQRHLVSHCPHRLVECACGLELQAHALEGHLKHDCAQAAQRSFLVLRARERLGYARPWAIEVAFDEGEAEANGKQAAKKGPEERRRAKRDFEDFDDSDLETIV